jgi:hypothetical protein
MKEYERYDADGSGSLSFNEFVIMVMFSPLGTLVTVLPHTCMAGWREVYTTTTLQCFDAIKQREARSPQSQSSVSRSCVVVRRHWRWP